MQHFLAYAAIIGIAQALAVSEQCVGGKATFLGFIGILAAILVAKFIGTLIDDRCPACRRKQRDADYVLVRRGGPITIPATAPSTRTITSGTTTPAGMTASPLIMLGTGITTADLETGTAPPTTRPGRNVRWLEQELASPVATTGTCKRCGDLEVEIRLGFCGSCCLAGKDLGFVLNQHGRWVKVGEHWPT